MIIVLVEPVLHVYVFAPLALNVALEPEQIVLDEGLTVVVGSGLTVTVVTVEFTQPAALVPVKV